MDAVSTNCHQEDKLKGQTYLVTESLLAQLIHLNRHLPEGRYFGQTQSL
jgi:hypothetical protein